MTSGGMLQNVSEEPVTYNFNEENVFVYHDERRNNFFRKTGKDLLHYKASENNLQQ
jgi:hypothetical protein